MNAKIAIEENARLINELFNSSKDFSERKGISIEEAIDFKASVMMKYSKSDNAKCAIELRAKEAKKMIKKEVVLSTQKELKAMVNSNRRNITNINGIEFTELYPILEVSSQHATYYDAETQSNKFLLPPFNITVK